MQANRKNSILLIITIWFVFGLQYNVNGQQEPQFSIYPYNLPSINPASTGSQQVLSLLFVSRLQWVGIDGAPRSYVFSLDAPLPKRNIGLGFSLVSDNIGPLTNNYFSFNYSHKINITSKTMLYMGLGLSLNNFYLGFTDLYVNDIDDDFLSQDFKKYLQPGLGTGLYLKHPNYYLGLSVSRVFQTTKLKDNIGKLKQHIYLSGGYTFQFGRYWAITPSFLGRSVLGAPTSVDISIFTKYNKFIGLGVSHRIDDSLIGIFELNLTDQLLFAYSYDFPTTDKVKSSNGSHEILIRFNFSNIKRDNFKSPRYF